MTDPETRGEGVERFLELATRSLEKTPEIREEAKSELLGRMAHPSVVKGDDSRQAALSRLENTPPVRRGMKMVAACSAVAILGGIAVWQGIEARKDASQLGGLPLMGNLERTETLADHLTPEQRDFVFAGIGADHEVLEKLERQIELHPNDPGIYEDYASYYLSARQKLPPGFHETWQRLDPGNGMWPLWEAVNKVNEWSRTYKPDAVKALPFREAVLLMEQSAAAPHFGSHRPELRNRRIALFKDAVTLGEETELLLFSISSIYDSSLRYRILPLQTLFAAQAEHLANEGDEAVLRSLIGHWERTCGRMGADGSSFLDHTYALAVVVKGGDALLAATRKLGMTAEEERIEKRMEVKVEAQKAFRGTLDPRPMGFIARMMGTTGATPDHPAGTEIHEPGRQVEYALADRGSALAGAIGLLVATGLVGIESLRRGRRVNGLSDGLRPLFRPVDQVWILGLGLVLPVAWYFAIRLSPLGCRDIGLVHFPIPPALIQAGGGLLLGLTLLVQTIRWRIARRAGFLSLRPRGLWSGWLVALVAAGVMPLAGVVRWMTGDPEDFLRPVAAACGVPLLWLLWQAGTVLFSTNDHALGGVILSRKLIAPLLFLAAMLLACWQPLKNAERRWLARDEITRSDRTHGGMTRWEAIGVDWIAGQFRRSFGEAAEP